MTDRECYAIPAKFLEAKKETNEWKSVSSVQQGHKLIQDAELTVKATQEKKALGHAVTTIRTPRDVVSPITRIPRDTWIDELGHGVTLAKKASMPLSMRAAAEFCSEDEKAIHRTPHVPPLYVYQSIGQTTCITEHGSYQRLTKKPSGLFTNLIH